MILFSYRLQNMECTDRKDVLNCLLTMFAGAHSEAAESGICEINTLFDTSFEVLGSSKSVPEVNTRYDSSMEGFMRYHEEVAGLDGVPGYRSDPLPGILVVKNSDTDISEITVCIGCPAVPNQVYMDGQFIPHPFTSNTDIRYFTHGGILRIAKVIHLELQSLLKGMLNPEFVKKITLCGHGVAGGVAVVCSLMISELYEIEIVTFGSPSVFYCESAELQTLPSSTTIRSYINGSDILPRCLGSPAPRASARAFAKLGLSLHSVPSHAWVYADSFVPSSLPNSIRFISYEEGCPVIKIPASQLEQLSILSVRLNTISSESISHHALTQYLRGICVSCKSGIPTIPGLLNECRFTIQGMLDEDLSDFHEKQRKSREFYYVTSIRSAQYNSTNTDSMTSDSAIQKLVSSDENLQIKAIETWKDGIIESSELVSFIASKVNAYLRMSMIITLNYTTRIGLINSALSDSDKISSLLKKYTHVLRPLKILLLNSRASLHRRNGSVQLALADLRKSAAALNSVSNLAVSRLTRIETYANLSATYLKCGIFADAFAAAIKALELLPQTYRSAHDYNKTAFPIGTAVLIRSSGERAIVTGHSRGRIGVRTDDRDYCQSIFCNNLTISPDTYKTKIGNELFVYLEKSYQTVTITGVCRGRVGIKLSNGSLRGIPCGELEEMNQTKNNKNLNIIEVIALHNLILASDSVTYLSPVDKVELHEYSLRLTEALSKLPPNHAVKKQVSQTINNVVAARIKKSLKDRENDRLATRGRHMRMTSPIAMPPKPQPTGTDLVVVYPAALMQSRGKLCLPPITKKGRPMPAQTWLDRLRTSKKKTDKQQRGLLLKELGWNTDSNPYSDSLQLSSLPCVFDDLPNLNSGLSPKEALLAEKAMYKEITKRRALVLQQRCERMKLKFRESRGRVCSIELSEQHHIITSEVRSFKALQRKKDSREQLIAGQIHLLSIVDETSKIVRIEEEQATEILKSSANLLRCVADETSRRYIAIKAEERDFDQLVRELNRSIQEVDLLRATSAPLTRQQDQQHRQSKTIVFIEEQPT